MRVVTTVYDGKVIDVTGSAYWSCVKLVVEDAETGYFIWGNATDGKNCTCRAYTVLGTAVATANAVTCNMFYLAGSVF